MSAVLVVVTYEAKPGSEEQLAGFLRTHLSRLREMGLLADKPSFAAERKDEPGRFVESFWWAHANAQQQAQDNSEVAELWMRLEDLCKPEGIRSAELKLLD